MFLRTALMSAAAVLLLTFASASLSGAEPSLSRLSWLAGCWRAADAEPGSGEHWTNGEGGVMLGVGRTIRGGKLLSYEFMRIGPGDDGKLAFIADPSGQSRTVFPVIRLTDSEVVFENPSHDFPQRVSYRSNPDGSLHARIEGISQGRQRSIDFPMLRADCNEYFR